MVVFKAPLLKRSDATSWARKLAIAVDELPYAI